MFSTPSFWALLLLAAALCQLLPEQAARARAAALALVSVAAVAAVVQLSPAQWGILALSVAWFLSGLRAASGRTVRRPFPTSLAICAPLLSVWVVGKSLTTSGAATSRVLLFVGASYLLVKSFTLAKDVCDGRVRNPDAVKVVAYLLFFPTFIAGPMHLYGEFEGTLARPEALTAPRFLTLALRFLWGLLKARYLGPLLHPLSLIALVDGGDVSIPKLIGASIVYSAVLLIEFSGYTDMAIATAGVIGIRTPENFRAPYLATSVREFWQRWHISFSRVLTGYLFIPLVRTLRGRMPEHRNALLLLGYGVTFVFCGFWHGSGPNYAVWGLYHATGLFVADVRRSAAPPVVASASASRRFPVDLRHVALVLGTFLFVSLGWILFVLPLDRVAQVIR